MKANILLTAVALLLLFVSDGHPRGFGGRGGGGGFREPAFHGTPAFDRGGFRDEGFREGGFREGGFRDDFNRGAFTPRVDHPTPNRGWDNNNWRNDRPGLDLGDRNIGNFDRNNIGNRVDSPNINRTNINNVSNNTINANRNVTNVNRNFDNRNWRNGYYNGYHPWVHGYWRWPGRYPYWWGAGVGAGTALWLGAPATTVVYSNPYYVGGTVVDDSPYDYSQALPAPAESQAAAQTFNPYDTTPAPAPAVATPAKPAVPPEATSNFDAARAAFKQGDYAKAEKLVDKAIQALPSDATLSEFRALVLFAEKKYQAAAATIHSVLAAGPGWDWDTVVSLYPDVDTYTKQLRALEAYQKDHPKDAAASFLLAYQYLMTGYNDSAVTQLENVVKNQPNDDLAAQMLKSLKQGKDTAPPPAP